MALPGRAQNAPCRGGCGKEWRGDHSWVCCWTCEGGPLAFCPPCGQKHVNSPGCLDSHRRKGLTGEVVQQLVIEAAA